MFQATGETNIPQNPRVGTKRYMAPEILDLSMNMSVFENFRRVDIYSFGLMMWETTRRCMTHDGVEEYALPFFDMVRLNREQDQNSIRFNSIQQMLWTKQWL